MSCNRNHRLNAHINSNTRHFKHKAVQPRQLWVTKCWVSNCCTDMYQPVPRRRQQGIFRLKWNSASSWFWVVNNYKLGCRWCALSPFILNVGLPTFFHGRALVPLACKHVAERAEPIDEHLICGVNLWNLNLWVSCYYAEEQDRATSFLTCLTAF